MLKNIGSNWALSVVQILVFMVLSPYVVRTLGKDANGVWVTIVSFTDPLRLLILGVPMASVRYIAQHVAKDDHEGASRAVATCLSICLFMGAVALFTGLALLGVFQSGYLGSERWAHLSPELTASARPAFLLMVGTVTLGFAARLPYGIFDAHHDFIARNLVMGSGFLLKLGLTVLLLSMEASLTLLATVQLSVLAAEFVAALLVVRRRHPEVRFGLAGIDRSLVRGILSFSVFAMLLNVGAQLAFRMDALVIGRFDTPDAATVYDIGNKIFEPLITLLLGIGMVVMPMATSLRAKGEEAGLTLIFERWTKIALAITLLVGLYLVVLGPAFLAGWFEGEYTPESGRLLRVLMGSFFLFLPVRAVALPLLMGLGRPGRPAIALCAMGVINVGLSVALIGPYGLFGVALGTAIPNVAYAVFVYVLACRELKTSPLTLPLWTLTRGTFGIVPPLLLLLWLERGVGIEGIVPALAAGVGYSVVFVLLWVFVVLRGDPHVDPWSQVRARLRPAVEGEGA